MTNNVRNYWCQTFKSTFDVSDTIAFVWAELNGESIFYPC